MVAIHKVIDTVAEIMTRPAYTVRPDALVAEAFDTMDEAGVATCPVTSESGELCGMVSRVDLLRALRPSRELRILDAADLAGMQVREVMRYGVVTVEPEDPLVAAIDLFVDTCLHALPVVQRGPGKPVILGIVTQGDALRYLMRGASHRT